MEWGLSVVTESLKEGGGMQEVRVEEVCRRPRLIMGPRSSLPSLGTENVILSCLFLLRL